MFVAVVVTVQSRPCVVELLVRIAFAVHVCTAGAVGVLGVATLRFVVGSTLSFLSDIKLVTIDGSTPYQNVHSLDIAL